MQTIAGNGFQMRSWRQDDDINLVRHANNPHIAGNLRDGFPNPYTLADAADWIKMVTLNSKDLIYAIEIEGEACGGIGLHGMTDVYRFNAEIGYWLSELHWGKGIVTEAVRLLVKHAFENYRWNRIYAGVFSNNISSMKVLEKCGFSCEAVFKKSVKKHDKYLNEHVYSLLKEDWVKKHGKRSD